MFVFFELPDDERHLVQVEVDRVPAKGEQVALTAADGEVRSYRVEMITTAVIGSHETHRGVTLIELRHLPDKPHDKSWLSRLTPFPN
jgi:hypothetical protein